MGVHVSTRRHQVATSSGQLWWLSEVQGTLALSSGMWNSQTTAFHKLFSLQLSLKEEGHGFLLRGIGSTVIRAFPMNAVTFGVFTFIMNKWGYKPEDMEHDTLESLQRKLANGACEVMSIKLDLIYNVL